MVLISSTASEKLRVKDILTQLERISADISKHLSSSVDRGVLNEYIRNIKYITPDLNMRVELDDDVTPRNIAKLVRKAIENPTDYNGIQQQIYDAFFTLTVKIFSRLNKDTNYKSQ